MAKHPAEVFGYPIKAVLELPKKALKGIGVLLRKTNVTNRAVLLNIPWAYALFNMATTL